MFNAFYIILCDHFNGSGIAICQVCVSVCLRKKVLNYIASDLNIKHTGFLSHFPGQIYKGSDHRSKFKVTVGHGCRGFLSFTVKKPEM